MPSKEGKDAIRKQAIKNAIDYGKAREGNIIGKVLAEFPDLKSDMKWLNTNIAAAVREVNGMSKEELEKEYKKYEKEFEEAQKIKVEKSSKPNFVLEGAVKGNFATRFAPEPNGYIQVGNGKAAWLGRELATAYQGTLALYFDDTNPEKEKQEYVDAIKRDVEWLGIKVDREYYSSDHIESMYLYAKQLTEKGYAYVCKCDAEKIKKLRFEGKECDHRGQTRSENAELWKKMIEGKFKDDEAVLRLKLDMKSLNTTMRDPVVFRIIHHEHYKQGKKYAVWPTYDFNTPIVDSLEGITDAIRSKEYELRDELYNKVLSLLKLRKPKIRTIARLEILDNMTSKRKINALIAEGVLWGYDDPRLITIAGLRRRGIVPEAIRNFVLRFGMSKVNSEVPIDMLLSENRKALDGVTKRLFFVTDPVKLVVEGAKPTEVKMKLHPDLNLGYRQYLVDDTFYISKTDAENLKKGEKIRLKDLFTVEIISSKGDTVNSKYVGNEQTGGKTIQWVDSKNHLKGKLVIPGRLLMDDKFNKNSLEEVKGFVESYAGELQDEEIVQFERIGFFRLDNRENLTFIGS